MAKKFFGKLNSASVADEFEGEGYNEDLNDLDIEDSDSEYLGEKAKTLDEFDAGDYALPEDVEGVHKKEDIAEFYDYEVPASDSGEDITTYHGKKVDSYYFEMEDNDGTMSDDEPYESPSGMDDAVEQLSAEEVSDEASEFALDGVENAEYQEAIDETIMEESEDAEGVVEDQSALSEKEMKALLSESVDNGGEVDKSQKMIDDILEDRDDPVAKIAGGGAEDSVANTIPAFKKKDEEEFRTIPTVKKRDEEEFYTSKTTNFDSPFLMPEADGFDDDFIARIFADDNVDIKGYDGQSDRDFNSPFLIPEVGGNGFNDDFIAKILADNGIDIKGDNEQSDRDINSQFNQYTSESVDGNDENANVNDKDSNSPNDQYTKENTDGNDENANVNDKDSNSPNDQYTKENADGNDKNASTNDKDSNSPNDQYTKENTDGNDKNANVNDKDSNSPNDQYTKENTDGNDKNASTNDKDSNSPNDQYTKENTDVSDKNASTSDKDSNSQNDQYTKENTDGNDKNASTNDKDSNSPYSQYTKENTDGNDKNANVNDKDSNSPYSQYTKENIDGNDKNANVNDKDLQNQQDPSKNEDETFGFATSINDKDGAYSNDQSGALNVSDQAQVNKDGQLANGVSGQNPLNDKPLEEKQDANVNSVNGSNQNVSNNSANNRSINDQKALKAAIATALGIGALRSGGGGPNTNSVENSKVDDQSNESKEEKKMSGNVNKPNDNESKKHAIEKNDKMLKIVLDDGTITCEVCGHVNKKGVDFCEMCSNYLKDRRS